MEQNNRWVDDRLAKLNPEEDWQPHVTLGLARFEGRRARRRFVPRILSVAAIAVVCILTFPQPRALAQRALAPCVEACESLVLSPGDIHAHLFRLMWFVHGFLGIAAPDFTATDANGANFRLSDYAGKVVLLNFWASWCPPCKKEIPWFAEFQKEYGADGFAVIGVSIDEDGWKAVRPVMESLKVNYRMALGNDALTQKFGGVESLPESLLISPDGRIWTKHTGITAREQFEREIVRALWSDLSDAERDRLRAQGL